MRTIYLLVGSTGEYDDHMRWNVKAFDTEAMAIDYREELHKIIDSQKDIKTMSCISFKDCSHLESLLKDLDPDVSVVYTGVQYNIEEIEMEEV